MAAALPFWACSYDYDQFKLGGTSTTTTGGDGASGGGAPTTTSSSSGAATASSSGGGSTGPEDCLDGVDDDGDSQVDCEDSDCAAFECVPELPPGWEGYFRVHDAAYPNPAPSACPDASAPTSYVSGPATAQCDTCACGALT
jgi:hypothetical protein